MTDPNLIDPAILAAEMQQKFFDATAGLPLLESERTGAATKLRNKVLGILMDQYAENLAGNIDELLRDEEDDETDVPGAEETPAGDPPPATEGTTPPPAV